MSTSHIRNALNMLREDGYVDPTTLYFYVTCAPPSGDMAQMAFEQELDEVLEAPVSSWVGIFERELKRIEK